MDSATDVGGYFVSASCACGSGFATYKAATTVPRGPEPTTMQHLDLTSTHAENLAMTNPVEAGEAGGPSAPFGISSISSCSLREPVASELNLESVRSAAPVLRRSRRWTVLQPVPELHAPPAHRCHGAHRSIRAQRHIMNRHAARHAGAGAAVRRQGDTDLAIGDRKFSGNAQRRDVNPPLHDRSAPAGFALASGVAAPRAAGTDTSGTRGFPDESRDRRGDREGRHPQGVEARTSGPSETANRTGRCAAETLDLRGWLGGKELAAEEYNTGNERAILSRAPSNSICGARLCANTSRSMDSG